MIRVIITLKKGKVIKVEQAMQSPWPKVFQSIGEVKKEDIKIIEV